MQGECRGNAGGMRGERLGNARVLGSRGSFCARNARFLEFGKQNSMRALHATHISRLIAVLLAVARPAIAFSPHSARHVGNAAIESAWRGFLSLRDPAGAGHPAGPPDMLHT